MLHAGAPRWLMEGGFFERPRFATGTILLAKLTRTGNALVRRQPLMALAGPFDEQYDLTGGEDTDLFVRLVAAGLRFVAVDSALVYEHVPLARTNVRWLLQRRFLAGVGGARVDYTGAPARERRWQVVRHFGLACKWGALGILALPAYRIYAVDRLLLAARMLGRCAFFTGFSYRPYLKDSWR
jgi:succinoglycan biosynthesis protein ExoM